MFSFVKNHLEIQNLFRKIVELRCKQNESEAHFFLTIKLA